MMKDEIEWSMMMCSMLEMREGQKKCEVVNLGFPSTTRVALIVELYEYVVDWIDCDTIINYHINQNKQ